MTTKPTAYVDEHKWRSGQHFAGDCFYDYPKEGTEPVYTMSKVRETMQSKMKVVGYRWRAKKNDGTFGQWFHESVEDTAYNPRLARNMPADLFEVEVIYVIKE